MRIRRKHNGNFAIVPNALVEDKRLSIEAKGLLAYLISRHDNWTIRHGHLQKELGIGRDKLRRILHELIRVGYLERDDDQPRDGDNQFAAYNYLCRDVPASKAPLAVAGSPLRGSRRRETRNGNNTESTKTESTNTPTKPSPQARADAPLAGEIELTPFGQAARDAGMTPVYEGSKPFEAWTTFRGADGMPLTDVIVELGKKRRVVWMPDLYPRRDRRRGVAAR